MSSRMEIQRIQNYVQTTGYSEGQESQIRFLQTTSKRVLWKIKPRLTCTRMMGKEMLQACTLSVRQNQKKRLKTLSFFMYLYPKLLFIYYLFIYFWVCFVFCRVMEESPQHHLSTSSGAKQTANVHLLWLELHSSCNQDSTICLSVNIPSHIFFFLLLMLPQTCLWFLITRVQLINEASTTMIFKGDLL